MDENTEVKNDPVAVPVAEPTPAVEPAPVDPVPTSPSEVLHEGGETPAPQTEVPITPEPIPAPEAPQTAVQDTPPLPEQAVPVTSGTPPASPEPSKPSPSVASGEEGAPQSAPVASEPAIAPNEAPPTAAVEEPKPTEVPSTPAPEPIPAVPSVASSEGRGEEDYKPQRPPRSFMMKLVEIGHAARHARYRKRLDRLMTIFDKEKKDSIENDDVEKFLHVCDKTASTYLTQLVKEGKLRREGASSATKYRKI